MIPFLLKNILPYSLSPDEKRPFFKKAFFKMHLHQVNNCKEYRNLATHLSLSCESEISEYPFIPVTLFKDLELKSTEDEVKLLTTSGTTGKVGKIYVDRETAKRQSLSSYNILADYIGKGPRPYLVFDAEETVRGGSMSGRGAAIMGLANFASDIHFLMDQDRNGNIRLNIARLRKALKNIGEEPFLLYGFTYILWESHKELESIAFVTKSINPKTLILHSGGWKRIAGLSVSKVEYNRSIAHYWGLKEENIIDFYGLVEQMGMLYPDCSVGFKHIPYWADIIIREADTLYQADEGHRGLMQLVSLLPLSSPSHNILTQDLGRIELLDKCKCGRRGKAFTFMGRVESSERRGCSDVYQSSQNKTSIS